jgi:hypothetical protein
VAGGAEGLVHGGAPSLIKEALRLLKARIDMVELGEGLTILRDMVAFD